MRKVLYSFLLTFFLSVPYINSQKNLAVPGNPGIEVYLLTINPGIETYSHYGHSAIRVKIPEKNLDVVYNWGVFDFSTPNFAWKFAKGRLDYILMADSFNSFISQYIKEERSVYQQKVNLSPEETDQLLYLISENLRPENVKYRYDFFYDDCSTRIRDLFEKLIGDDLMYPPPVKKSVLPTFREKVGEYQRYYPWLKVGIDLIMGLPADKKASERDQMFLPFDLQTGLSEAVINKGGRNIPLLQNPQAVIEFDLPEHKNNILTSPLIVLGLMLIAIIIFSAAYRRERLNRIVDILLFTVFSILAVLMIFFNFFSDHQQMKWNLNIIWLNPFLIMCLVSLIFNLNNDRWFRIVFYLELLMLLPMFFMPAVFNNAFIPLCMIIMLRSSMRADFSWNPFSLITGEIASSSIHSKL